MFTHIDLRDSECVSCLGKLSNLEWSVLKTKILQLDLFCCWLPAFVWWVNGSLEINCFIKKLLCDSKDENKKMQPYLLHRLITFLNIAESREIKPLARLISHQPERNNSGKWSKNFYQDTLARESFNFAYCDFALF